MRGGWLFVCIPIREKINKPLLGKNGSLAFDFNAEDWLLGFWNKYLIFKDHFVACSRQPRQVFSVCLWFTPYDSINSCWRNMCIIKFKS